MRFFTSVAAVAVVSLAELEVDDGFCALESPGVSCLGWYKMPS
jgi:hypothetical protein